MICTKNHSKHFPYKFNVFNALKMLQVDSLKAVHWW